METLSRSWVLRRNCSLTPRQLCVAFALVGVTALLVSLAWALSEGDARTWRHRALVLACIVPFLVPGATWIELQVHAGRVPSAIVDAWWWRAIVVPHQVWALLVMASALLLAQATEARTA